MFNNFTAFWRGKDFLTKVLNDFNMMCEDTQGMFGSVLAKLLENKAEEGLKSRIYNIDKRVNKLEREIRKRIIEHLSMQPGVNVPSCLIMMSIVKDAERIGDYCKNLFEVTELLQKPLNMNEYNKLFGDIHVKLMDEFKKTRDSFNNSDEGMAREVLRVERGIVRRCDEIIKLLADCGMATNSAVCMTLMARYFKRISSHLANISTSVILPVSNLDFFDEKTRQEANEQ